MIRNIRGLILATGDVSDRVPGPECSCAGNAHTCTTAVCAVCHGTGHPAEPGLSRGMLGTMNNMLAVRRFAAGDAPAAAAIVRSPRRRADARAARRAPARPSSPRRLAESDAELARGQEVSADELAETIRHRQAGE